MLRNTVALIGRSSRGGRRAVSVLLLAAGTVDPDTSPSGAVDETSRRSAVRPRITIHALMWFVLIVALVNGLIVMVARRLRATGTPSEQTHQQEVAAFLVVNAYTFALCWFSFYDPWWRGKTRREWFRRLLISMPCWFLFAFALLCVVAASLPAGIVLRLLPVFIVLFVLGPLMLAVGISIEIWRVVRSQVSSRPAESAATLTDGEDPAPATSFQPRAGIK
jgi:hypothetical protein